MFHERALGSLAERLERVECSHRRENLHRALLPGSPEQRCLRTRRTGGDASDLACRAGVVEAGRQRISGKHERPGQRCAGAVRVLECPKHETEMRSR